MDAVKNLNMSNEDPLQIETLSTIHDLAENGNLRSLENTRLGAHLVEYGKIYLAEDDKTKKAKAAADFFTLCWEVNSRITGANNPDKKARYFRNALRYSKEAYRDLLQNYPDDFFEIGLYQYYKESNKETQEVHFDEES